MTVIRFGSSVLRLVKVFLIKNFHVLFGFILYAFTFFFWWGGGEVIALDKISKKVEKNKAECIITRAEFHPEQRPLKLL